MKRLLALLVTCSVLFGCSEKDFTDPCDPEFIGPPEAGQCD